MQIAISLSKERVELVRDFSQKIIGARLVLGISAILSVGTIIVSFLNDWIVRYGDSESHLNIAKRVIDGLTPGFAQLGGIWLPIPHMLMMPFVWSDYLWRTGLGGSIVSGIAFVVASVFLYKTAHLLTKNKFASFAVALVFMLNPNALYMQSTPMTEILLIAFFTLSTFYFIKFLLGQDQLGSLILAAAFGFCCVLTRYDGWFLVMLEAVALVLYYIPWRSLRSYTAIRQFMKTETFGKMEGHVLMFVTMAFFGILIWLMWDFLILGDPLYFSHSEFSARAQQEVWQAAGQLPTYHNLPQAFLYYFVTAMSNAGVLVFFPALIGFVLYLTDKLNPNRWLIGLVLGTPFIFNIVTLFMGQSIIFIPHLTPLDWDHSLFNVRYGLMALPFLAMGWGWLFYKSKFAGRMVLVGLFIAQFGLYYVGYSQVVTWQDGATGLSAALRPEAERWIADNYDFGLVLMDDYARTVSVVRSGIPMQNMIYIGNKPYWEESLQTPDKHAEWIVMQENDAVYKSLWEIPARRGRLQKYYDLVYKSSIAPNISIYRKKILTQQFWNYECIDTMKFSRDAARALIQSPQMNAFIDRELTLIKDAGASCVSLGTAYDEEFVPYLKAWVDKARAKDLTVWFRGNMSGWEGWFDHSVFTNPIQHHEGVYNLITKHPELFAPGDIFTPAPEPENGMLGDPRTSTANRDKFVKFLPESYENCVNAFRQIKIDVTCGYYSMNGDVAKQILTKDLLVKIGDVVVIDHYVKDSDRLISDIKFLKEKLDAPIVLGEIGAPIPDIHGNLTEDEQADYIDEMFKKLYQEQDIILGVNYWVFRGGSTALVDESGNIKKAYGSLRNYFMPTQIRGTVRNTIGDPVAGIKVRIDEFNAEALTNHLGLYTLAVPAGTDTQIKLATDDYSGEKNRQLQLEVGADSEQNFIIDPNHKGIRYRFQQWVKTILN